MELINQNYRPGSYLQIVSKPNSINSFKYDQSWQRNLLLGRVLNHSWSHDLMWTIPRVTICTHETALLREYELPESITLLVVLLSPWSQRCSRHGWPYSITTPFEMLIWIRRSGRWPGLGRILQADSNMLICHREHNIKQIRYAAWRLMEYHKMSRILPLTHCCSQSTQTNSSRSSAVTKLAYIATPTIRSSTVYSWW